MEPGRWPTFGEVLQYLRELGFEATLADPGKLVCSRPDDDARFTFRDRDRSTPARETELLTLKSQLTYRGFVTEDEYARFWNRGVRRNTSQPETAV